jgi:hypothetical protein
MIYVKAFLAGVGALIVFYLLFITVSVRLLVHPPPDLPEGVGYIAGPHGGFLHDYFCSWHCSSSLRPPSGHSEDWNVKALLETSRVPDLGPGLWPAAELLLGAERYVSR